MYIAPTCIETLLPGPAARGYGLAYAESIWWGVLEIEKEALALRDALHDLDVAAGPSLDLLGDWVSEQREGLADADYRRIIAGRRVAIAGGITPAAVLRGWRGVTGDQAALLDEYPTEVILTATVSYIVNSAWLARAAGVTGDMIPNGRVLYAIVAGPESFRWGFSSFDSAGFAHDFSG